MSKWLIGFVLAIVVGAALWMTHREGIVIAFALGLVAG